MEQGSVGQPGVACTGMVNWVRRNSRAVSSAIPILYIRRGEGEKAPWLAIPLGGKGLELSLLLVRLELWHKR